MVKCYEIVTQGGVRSTQPPLAVVYFDGSFPKPKSAKYFELCIAKREESNWPHVHNAAQGAHA